MTNKNPITVRRGETYKVPRSGKQAAYVLVLGVRKNGGQPKVTYRRVSRSGKRRPGESVNVRWLTFREGAWRLPESWSAA